MESYAIQNKKTVQKTLTRAIYYDKYIYLFDVKKKIFYLYHDNKKNPIEINPKKSKAFFIDKESNEVFDMKSVTEGNPIRVGFIGDYSKFKKKIG